MTTVFNASGINKTNFEAYTNNNPATYRDWSRTWDQVSNEIYNYLDISGKNVGGYSQVWLSLSFR